MLRARMIAAALAICALSALAVGCGDSNSEPSIPRDEAVTLVSDLEEIQANVDEGSCVVAQDRTDAFIQNVQDLPSDVPDDVRQALENGANQLQILLGDPDQCDTQTETQTETTKSETTETRETEPTTTTRPTTTTETKPPPDTQVQPNPGGGSGGVGPGQGGL